MNTENFNNNPLIQSLASNALGMKSSESDTLDYFAGFADRLKDCQINDDLKSMLVPIYAHFKSVPIKKGTLQWLKSQFFKIADKDKSTSSPIPCYTVLDGWVYLITSTGFLMFESELANGFYDESFTQIDKSPSDLRISENFLNLSCALKNEINDVHPDNWELVNQSDVSFEKTFFYFDFQDKKIAIPISHRFIIAGRGSFKCTQIKANQIVIDTPYQNMRFYIGLLDWSVVSKQIKS